MTATLADLAPTDDELTRLHAALTEVIGGPVTDWRRASFDAMGLDAFDRVSLATCAEAQFGVFLDDHFAGEDTVADLLAAIRRAPRPGELPHA